ncbi:biotin biosynthesis protein, BioH [Salinisphaera sp. PC39]|uniref:pimeloyl-ACP methyl ester esterase BioH n=1 Tax=Salinisphaera sp. PC39 TaxID=1304156 RepID=UPI0033410475
MPLAVSRSGRGADLVCAHGWGLSGAVWEPLAERIGDRVRVHAADLPGHGATPAGAVGLNNWTDELVAAAPDKAVYLGWSLGGLLCLNAARRHPDRVAGLILVATLPRMLRAGDWPYGMRASAVAETARGLREDYVTTLQEFLMLQVLAEPGARHLIRRLRNDLLSRPPAREGLERGLDILHEADLRSALPSIDVPALVIAGERDRMCHPEGMARMAEALPRGELWRVERAAHAPFLSHERDFAERVAGFVADVQKDANHRGTEGTGKKSG